nr:MAG TPA: hypothetical protein [Caudoviricetes sp.]
MSQYFHINIHIRTNHLFRFPYLINRYDLQIRFQAFTPLWIKTIKYMELTMLRHLILQCHNIVYLMSARLIYTIGIFNFVIYATL